MSRPGLSAVMLIGARRGRARAALDAFAAQTATDAIELIVVDLLPDAPRLPEPRSPRTAQVVLPPSTPWGSARAAGVRAAEAPVVAFIEDHCTPEPGWAEALLETHREPWAAVGYAFRSNAQRWRSRVNLMAEYGPWTDPAAGGPTQVLPSNNISYKRDLLLSLGDELDAALRIDNNLHARLAAQGLEGAIEPRALVHHHELPRVTAAAAASHVYSRLLAADRARDEGWPLWRRLLYAIALPLGSPARRAARQIRLMDGRGRRWDQIATVLPAATFVWFWSAVGQSLGCLLGPGDAERRLVAWELEAHRPSAEPIPDGPPGKGQREGIEPSAQ
jgi:hypothetical protein